MIAGGKLPVSDTTLLYQFMPNDENILNTDLTMTERQFY